MKKHIAITIVFVFLLCACGSNMAESNGQTLPNIASASLTWQEQYDLGIRYLSEGRYQEAIIAFTAAIEIDPKQALTYVGRGDAYAGMISDSETETQSASIKDYYSNAEADYLVAIELEPNSAETYLKLAVLYVAMDELDLAAALLEDGYALTGDEELRQMLDSLSAAGLDEEINDDTYGQTKFTERAWYYNFADLPSDVQEFIETMVPAIVANDVKTMRHVPDVSDPDSFPSHAYTFWNGYKIQSLGLPNREYELSTNPKGNSSSFGLEIRPKEGDGYYCIVSTSWINDQVDYDRSRVTRASCNCTDWQYNGTMIYKVLESIRQNNEIVDVISYMYTGTIVNGLCEGTFLYKSGWEIGDDGSGPGYEKTDIYEGGIGMTGRKNKWIGYIDYYGVPTIYENVDADYMRQIYGQSIRDQIYW